MDRERPKRGRLYIAGMFGITSLILALWAVLSGTGHLLYATHGLPHVTVTVWGITTPIGFNPNASVEDIGGLTLHVATSANPQSIVNNIENTTHPGGPCGMIFWNPVTNFFKWYGFGFGFQAGLSLNRSAPTKTDTGTGKTFQQGDVWGTNTSCPGLLMNFRGSDNWRTYRNELGSFMSTWGVQVDQTSGKIWFTEKFAGNITQLDPATNGATRFAIGGNPGYIAVDTAGRAYTAKAAGSSGVDEIVRVNAGTGEVVRWALPAGALTSGFVFGTPNGISIDAAGNVWFAESSSSKIGRLSGGPDGVLGTADDLICEFTKSGLANPQLIANTGSLGLSQAYFTEGAGNAASVLTQVEAIGTCTTVAPTIATLTPATVTFAAVDFTEQDTASGCPCAACRSPLTATITPTTSDIPGLDGGCATGPGGTCPGTTTTSTGLPITGILRFPFPSASPPTSVSQPSGMTGVVLPSTIFGSDISNNNLFEVKSDAIIAPPPPPPGAKCPLTQGFWKNHPNAWPVSSLILGSQSYTEAELLTILGTPPKGDASLILADQLIAAKLNIANGSNSAPVSSTITDADSLLSGFTGKLPYNVKTSSATGQAMVTDGGVLDSYNSTLLTPGCIP